MLPQTAFDLNPEQKSSAEAPAGPLLIVAGAGTGKTRTLTNRLLRFIEEGVPPGKICALTFTNKAAKEMIDRLAPALKQKVSGVAPCVGTFHALGARILHEEAGLWGRGPNFVIFDNHDSFDLIKKLAKRFLPEEDKKKKVAPAFFAQKISDIKNTDAALGELKRSQKPQDVLAVRVFESYEAELKRHNAFDFDDLIEKVVRLFKEQPEILKKHQKKFEVVLVDEYQDLNPKQYDLVRLLAGEHKNLSVVGDDEQMIYGWRYANLAIFFNFEKDWPGARVKFLEENYRSTSNIIQAASAVALNNQYRRPKNLWTKNPSGAPVKIAEFEDESAEAEWAAQQIEKENIKNQKGTTVILYRTNAQSRAFEQSLIRREIPYQIFGGLKFYERREVKDVVAALRYAVNPKDDLSRERLLRSLGQRKFAELKATLQNQKNPTPVSLIEVFLKSTGYFDFLERNFLNYAEREENISELLGFAVRFDKLSPFLEEIALVQSTDNLSSSKSRHVASKIEGVVNLMTIHLAKGLEFDKVFVAGCSEGLLPHSMSMENEYELEEERRLMYVAMTRARRELFISFYDLPSRFLGEIPEALFEFESPDVYQLDQRGDEESYVRF